MRQRASLARISKRTRDYYKSLSDALTWNPYTDLWWQKVLATRKAQQQSNLIQERRTEMVKMNANTVTTRSGSSLTSSMKSGAIDGKTAYKGIADIAGSREG